MSTVLPNSIASKQHVIKLDELAGERLSQLDLGVLLIYLINTVDADALPYLGAQFDVMGYKGWKYADTEQKKRDLIKKAIELHRYKGTPWSIKEALKVIGVLNCLIEEGIALYYNNEAFYDGFNSYGGGNWARFRVKIPTGTWPVMTAALLNETRALILEYKNCRSHLVDVQVYQNDTEAIGPSEALTIEIGTNYAEVVGSPSYDTRYSYNAAINHTSFDDLLAYS